MQKKSSVKDRCCTSTPLMSTVNDLFVWLPGISHGYHLLDNKENLYTIRLTERQLSVLVLRLPKQTQICFQPITGFFACASLYTSPSQNSCQVNTTVLATRCARTGMMPGFFKTRESSSSPCCCIKIISVSWHTCTHRHVHPKADIFLISAFSLINRLYRYGQSHTLKLHLLKIRSVLLSEENVEQEKNDRTIRL